MTSISCTGILLSIPEVVVDEVVIKVVGATSVVTDDCVEYIILLYSNDTVYVYGVSDIRPDITTPSPIVPSPIPSLGLSVIVTGVVSSTVLALNVKVMVLNVLFAMTVTISCTDTIQRILKIRE